MTTLEHLEHLRGRYQLVAGLLTGAMTQLVEETNEEQAVMHAHAVAQGITDLEYVFGEYREFAAGVSGHDWFAELLEAE